jgi:glycosyltransferase involved in cell wall biosynthesis
MKILFLSDNFPPEVNAPANRTYEHCVEWVKKGAEVTVITCTPNFPQGKVYAGYKNKIFQKTEMDGIRVIRVWSYISPNKGIAKRTLDYLSYAFMAFVASLFIKTDLIVATSPQFFTAVSGYLASILKRKKWVMEVRDLWPESIRAVNAMKDGFYFRWLEGLELFLYRKALRIVVVTDAFKDNIASRGIPEEKIDVVKNGVRLDLFKPQVANKGLIEKYRLDGKFVVGYIGTHGMAHSLDFILRAAKDAPAMVHFLFIGDGAEKARLIELHAQLKLSNVTMIDAVPKQNITSYISMTDVALVPLKKSDTFKTVIPSKIFENAAMQKPILLGVEGESKEIIEAYGAGACFEPENKVDFIAQLNKIYLNPSFYASCQTGCIKLAEDFDRKKLAAKMYGILARIHTGREYEFGKSPQLEKVGVQ